MTTDVLIDVDDVSRRFGGVTALDGVSLSIRRGELLGLIGPNGAGKTTFINVVSGAEKPSSGRILFNGQPAPKSLEKSVDRGIVRTFQTPRAFAGLTVDDNLTLARSSPSAGPTASTTASGVVDNLATELSEWSRTLVTDLPYGVLRRLSILLALSTNPTFLLMDEPCVGLSSDEVEQLGTVIRSLNEAGLTILLVEHNVGFVMGLADRIAVLHKGAVLFTGTPEECQSSAEVQDVYLGRST